MRITPVALLAIAGASCVLVGAWAQPAAVSAQPAAAKPAESAPQEASDNLHQVLDMFRSDLNQAKVRMLNQVMKLTAAEAEKFWPIYTRYEADLGKVNDHRIALIKEFVTLSASGKFGDQNASELAASWLQVAQDRLDLWKKYQLEISTAVSPVRSAQFLQVEHQIALLVDINIASEMPIVGQTK